MLLEVLQLRLEGVLADHTRNARIDAVDVRGVIEHVVELAILQPDRPFTIDEVRGIGLDTDDARRARPRGHLHPLERDIGGELADDSHGADVVETHVLDGDVP